MPDCSSTVQSFARRPLPRRVFGTTNSPLLALPLISAWRLFAARVAARVAARAMRALDSGASVPGEPVGTGAPKIQQGR